MAGDSGQDRGTKPVRCLSLQPAGDFSRAVDRALKLLHPAGALRIVKVNRDCPHDALIASAACACPAEAVDCHDKSAADRLAQSHEIKTERACRNRQE